TAAEVRQPVRGEPAPDPAFLPETGPGRAGSPPRPRPDGAAEVPEPRGRPSGPGFPLEGVRPVSRPGRGLEAGPVPARREPEVRPALGTLPGRRPRADILEARPRLPDLGDRGAGEGGAAGLAGRGPEPDGR